MQVLEDVGVHLGQAQGRALDALEDGPVSLHVLDDLDGELLLHLRIQDSRVSGGEGRRGIRQQEQGARTSSRLSASSGLKSAGTGACDMMAGGGGASGRCETVLVSRVLARAKMSSSRWDVGCWAGA